MTLSAFTYRALTGYLGNLGDLSIWSRLTGHDYPTTKSFVSTDKVLDSVCVLVPSCRTTGLVHMMQQR